MSTIVQIRAHVTSVAAVDIDASFFVSATTASARAWNGVTVAATLAAWRPASVGQ
jgi:hypothetical protein